MKSLIKKINKQKNNLQQRSIINSVNTIQENNQMRNREKFYEVDLSLLRESVADAADEIAHKQMEEELEKDQANEKADFLNQMEEMGGMYGDVHEEEDGPIDEYSFLFEQDEAPADLDDLGGADAGEEAAGAEADAVELPLDLAQELQSILDAELAGGAEGAAAGEEAGGLEDLDMGDMDSEDDSEEESSEEDSEGEGLYEEASEEEGAGLYELDSEDVDKGEGLYETYDVDPIILQQELAKIRKSLNEGNVDHHFGGKAGGHAGVDGAFGGKGPKKHGYQKSFGGGSYGKDVFVTPPSTLKKLNEAIQQLRKLSRMNRAQNEKLNKYRGAVHTLREQLEDLNLFNAKLLYVNKLLQNKNLNESQKKSVIKALDEAKSLGETKALFNSLTESLSTPKSTLNESTRFGSSSRTTTSGSGNKNRTVGESDRWARLAGLK
jgi:hypothetical protein